MVQSCSQPEHPSHLIRRNGLGAAGIEIGQSFQRDPTILDAYQRLVAVDEIGRYYRGGPLLTSPTRYVGDLPTERGPIHSVGKVISRLADRKFGVGAHILCANYANLATC